MPLLGRAEIRDAFVDSLVAARRKHGFELFAWVVMPEHVHLLVRPCGVELVDSLRSLKTSVSKRVVGRWRELGAPVLERVRTDGGAVRFW